MKKPLPPYLNPVNILEEGADEKIKQQGRVAREMAEKHFDLECSVHGVFAYLIAEGGLEREIERHRN